MGTTRKTTIYKTAQATKSRSLWSTHKNKHTQLTHRKRKLAKGHQRPRQRSGTRVPTARPRRLNQGSKTKAAKPGQHSRTKAAGPRRPNQTTTKAAGSRRDDSRTTKNPKLDQMLMKLTKAKSSQYVNSRSQYSKIPTN